MFLIHGQPEKKHPGSVNLRQVAILNFVGSHISCQNYFCRIAKFGEDVVNHCRVEDFQYGVFDLEL